MTMLCAVAAGFAASAIDLAGVRARSGGSGWNYWGPMVQTDIEITSRSVIEVEVEMYNVSALDNMIFCSRSATKSPMKTYTLQHVAGKGWRFDYNNSAAAEYGGLAVEGGRYTLRTTPDGLWVNGEKTLSKTAADFETPARLVLFSGVSLDATTGDPVYVTTGRGNFVLYSCKVWTPDESGALQLKANLTPRLTTAGRVGLRDSVADKTYESAFDEDAKTFPLNPYYLVEFADGPEGLRDAFAYSRASQLNAAGTDYLKNSYAMVDIAPGTYDLKDIAMSETSHLIAKLASAGSIRGLGATPADTVLLGLGDADTRRIIEIGYMTLTNVTVTGGHCTTRGAGGGVLASNSQWNPSAVLGCVVSNNYCAGNVTSHEGGGIDGAWTVRGCLIADNLHEYMGGGLAGCNTVEDCVIRNNRSGTGGGAGGSSQTTFSGCTFESNSATKQAAAVGGAKSMTDCTIVNHVAIQSVVSDAKMARCTIADCGTAVDNSKQPFFCIYNSASTAKSAVNCVFDGIVLSNAADRVVGKYQLVNCTVRRVKNAENGPLAATATAVNTIIADNLPYDVVAESMPTLSTCLYRRASGEIPSAGCTQVDDVRWAKTGPRGSIKCNSPAYNAADESGTILTQVGALDCAGNPRVAFGHLDIGAQECQSDKLPGMQVLLR